jgi:tetratricopeptide (TPR) repeat protein
MPDVVYTIAGSAMLLVVATFIGWLMVRALKRSEDPTRLVVKWICTLLVAGVLAWILGGWGPSVGSAFVVPFVCVGLGIALSVIWAPSLASLLARPLTSLFDGGSTEITPEPLYSTAQAKRKKGKGQEAIWEIQRQLGMFPNDFTGQMMMAEIQAQDLNDLPAAQATITRLCQQSGHTPASLAAALNQLADWHLKLAQDPAAAGQALEQIVQRLPDSSWSYAASQRLAHLTTSDQLLEAHDRRPIHLAHVEPSAGAVIPQAPPPPSRESAVHEAQALVKHLEQFPEDNDARENLAAVYLRHYQRLDLASAELEQLISQTQAPPRKVVHWLNLLADWQLESGGDEAGARQTLQRIIDAFPDHSAAELARNRLSHLKLEMKKTSAAPVVKLGTYDQDLGLKRPGSKTSGVAG